MKNILIGFLLAVLTVIGGFAGAFHRRDPAQLPASVAPVVAAAVPGARLEPASPPPPPPAKVLPVAPPSAPVQGAASVPAPTPITALPSASALGTNAVAGPAAAVPAPPPLPPLSPASVQATVSNVPLDRARAAMQREFTERGIDPLAPPTLFMGDFSGDGVDDAVVFYVVPSGGSAVFQHALLLKADGSGFSAVGDLEATGLEPKDLKFSKHAVEYTGTIAKPGDPHCCPTGSARFRIAINGHRLSVAPVGASASAKRPPAAPKEEAPPNKPSTPNGWLTFAELMLQRGSPSMREQKTLARLAEVQSKARTSPLGQPVFSLTAGLNVLVVPSRDGQTDNGRYCREFFLEVQGERLHYVGCSLSGKANDSWRYQPG